MSLSIKKEFYSNLTMKSITDAYYKQKTRVWEDFGLQNLGQYNDLYVQSDTMLLADAFENSRNKC